MNPTQDQSTLVEPDALGRLAAKAQGLYTLPAVAVKVLELTDDPQVDTQALTECIENDPALTARLLKVVNSSLFGLSRKVSDLNQALALLGTKPLKLLVLGFSLPPGLCDGLGTDVLRRYWRHTLAKAVASRRISRSLCPQRGDEAFLAGLLQDLGVLVLIQQLGEPYSRFFERVFSDGGDLIALEVDSMGFHHAMLGARLLAQWNLPEVLVDAVSCVGGPPPEGSACPPELARVLELADLFARFLNEGHGQLLSELIGTGRPTVDLTLEELEQLLGETREQVQQLAEMLGPEIPDGLGCDDLTARAHRRLSAVAADAAEELIRHDRPPQEPDSVAESLADECRSLAAALSDAAQGSGSTTSSAAPPERKQPADDDNRPDPGLIGRLAAGVAASRASRTALSLLLVELNDPAGLMLNLGAGGFGRLMETLHDAARAIDHPHAVCHPHGEAGFAVILRQCERQPAVRLANALLDQFRRAASLLESGGAPSAGVSLGVATVAVPSKSFQPDDLLADADRCLNASQSCGGGVVKSIETY